MKKNILIGGLIAGAFVAGSFGSATAQSLIGSSQIRDGGVHKVDLSSSINKSLDSTLRGAKFRVENYQNGGGGSATVACANDDTKSQNWTAIAGGVQGSTVAHQAADSFAVTSSFPGRMNWDTGTPKEGRTDGWIVLGNGQYTDTLKVWALCVRKTDIGIKTINLDN